MPAIRRNPGLILFWKIHRWLLQKTNGRFGSTLLGHSVLLLTTTGRRTGEARTIALYTFPYGTSYVVVASNVGEHRHPGWYLNLRDSPDAEIRFAGRRFAVRARDAEGEERQHLWEMITAHDGTYAEYQARTDRQIPVVVLDPQKPDQG